MLASELFLKQSDAIGDQRILRLRYGQFLGEEAEGGPKLSPTADAAQDQHAPVDDDHGHETPNPPAPVFGQIDHLLENFGHTHDIAEAATLLDLKHAPFQASIGSNVQWNCSYGAPFDRALPFATRHWAISSKSSRRTAAFFCAGGPTVAADRMKLRGGR